MKYIPLKNLILYIILILYLCTPLNAATKVSESSVLLIYDEDNTSLNLPLTQLTHSYGIEIDTLEANKYTSNIEKDYSSIILTTPKPFSTGFKPYKKQVICIGDGYDQYIHSIQYETFISTEAKIEVADWSGQSTFLKDLSVISSYTGQPIGTLNLSFNRSYPFAVFEQGMYFIPYVNANDISLVGLGEVIQMIYNSENQKTLYVLLDNISIFSNFDLLAQTADVFYEHGVPFIVRIEPIYTNYDYPAFSRFISILKYIQSRNGTILLKPSKKIDEVSLVFKEEGIDLITTAEQPYPLTYEYLSSIHSLTKDFKALPFNAALIYELPKSIDEITQLITKLDDKWLSLYDITPYTINAPYTEEGSEVISELQSEEKVTTFSTFFHLGNIFLFVIVGISICLFVSIIALGNHLYKQKFYLKNRRK